MTRRSESATLRARATRIGCSVDELRAHDDAGESWCSTCRQWLAAEAFHGNMARPTGAHEECRWCRSRGKMARRYGVAMTVALVREARDLYAWGAWSERLAVRYGEPREALLRAIAAKVPMQARDAEWLMDAALRRGKEAA